MMLSPTRLAKSVRTPNVQRRIKHESDQPYNHCGTKATFILVVALTIAIAALMIASATLVAFIPMLRLF